MALPPMADAQPRAGALDESSHRGNPCPMPPPPPHPPVPRGSATTPDVVGEMPDAVNPPKPPLPACPAALDGGVGGYKIFAQPTALVETSFEFKLRSFNAPAQRPDVEELDDNILLALRAFPPPSGAGEFWQIAAAGGGDEDVPPMMVGVAEEDIPSEEEDEDGGGKALLPAVPNVAKLREELGETKASGLEEKMEAKRVAARRAREQVLQDGFQLVLSEIENPVHRRVMVGAIWALRLTCAGRVDAVKGL
jgi:hypothetical protein